MDNYIIRKLNINDYNNFLILINEFRQSSFTNNEFKNILEKININSDIWVIEINNELIGTATILYEYKYIYNICILAHIEDVCIKKNYRDKGYGKILINKLFEEAKLKECYKITLDCSDENINFYVKCNFQKRGNQMSYLF